VSFFPICSVELVAIANTMTRHLDARRIVSCSRIPHYRLTDVTGKNCNGTKPIHKKRYAMSPRTSSNSNFCNRISVNTSTMQDTSSGVDRKKFTKYAVALNRQHHFKQLRNETHQTQSQSRETPHRNEISNISRIHYAIQRGTTRSIWVNELGEVQARDILSFT
jgi:hypothetical protein